METIYFDDTEDLPDPDPDPDYCQHSGHAQTSSGSAPPCSRGHRSTMTLPTQQGGAICLLCFSNLVTDPLSRTLHVSYALSQLSCALSQPIFLRSLLAFHPHLLVSPLVRALASFDDAPIARQLLALVAALCDSADHSVRADFVASVSDRLSSGSLAWDRRQLYTLHCFGNLVKCDKEDNLYAHIKDKYAVFSNLVEGLRVPSDEIRGEILFILYRLARLEEDHGTHILSSFCPMLLHMLLDALLKIQRDDVRLNCLALLTVLAQRGLLEYEESLTQERDGSLPPFSVVFADAIKGPLLSTDTQVQITTLNLLLCYVSSTENIQVLVEENVADYVFEILRLSECKDPVVNSCVQVLDRLSAANHVFKQRLVVGFATLLPVLHYVSDIPFHPVQNPTFRLICICVSDCPGILSSYQLKELNSVLTRMLQKHADGEIGMLAETFTLICSIFTSLLKSPSSQGICDFKEALQHAVISCLSGREMSSCQLLQSLNLLKEVYVFSHEENTGESNNVKVQNCILDICTTHLLPWFVNNFKEVEEDIVVGLLETFHLMLLWDSDEQASKFAENLVSSSWFSLSFECLGIFPINQMKEKVYLILGSIVELIIGNDSGQSITIAASYLPSDPIDLLFLLGQNSPYSSELCSSQYAILTILYVSSLYDERLADDKLVLDSLENYILSKETVFGLGATDSSWVTKLLYLYGFYRGLAKMSYQIPHNPEAERILMQLVSKYEWDVLSARIHPISLKWLFQQDRFCESLSDQIMQFCQTRISNSSDSISCGKDNCMDNVEAIAELVASGDNYGARLIVCLLMKEDVEESNLISLVNLLTKIINISPAASDQLCSNNIGNALHRLFSEKNHILSSETFTPLLILIFKLLSSAQPKILSDDEIWVAVIMKLMEFITADNFLGISILCLVLIHSANNALIEASKTVLFNSSLASIVESVIEEACQKGPALTDHYEGTSYGERLVFSLLLNFFSLKSLCSILPRSIDWQSFFDPPYAAQELSVIGIPCHDLCRLVYYGSPLTKLVASHCLVELFSGILDTKNAENEEIKCSFEYLMSVITVIQGFLFYSDHRVAMNCGICVSLMFGEKFVIGKYVWSKVVVEELAVTLSAPSLVSKSFFDQHKPAIYVAIAILKQENLPEWMRCAFDEPCITGTLENLTASNVISEIVVLFRELLNSKMLKPGHIEKLNRVFQASQKRLYADNKGGCDDELTKVVLQSCESRDICDHLIFLMSSNSFRGRGFGELNYGSRGVLEEIELFFTSSMGENESV